MSSLDKFFRKKLEERSFPQDDLAWQEMEALLEDKEDRRPMLGWFFFFLGCTMIGATLFINAPANGNDKIQESILSRNDISKTKNIGKEIPEENEIVELDGKIIKGSEETISVETELKTNSDSKQKSISTFKNNIAINKDLEKTSVKNQSKTINSKREKRAQKIESTTPKILNAADVIQKGLPNKLIQTPLDQKTNIEPATENNIAKEKVNIAESQKDEAEGEIPKKAAELDFLNKPFFPVGVQEDEEAKLPGRLKKSPRFADLQLGFRLEQAFLFPLADNREALILAAGPVFNYPINRAWSLDAGIHYKYVSADFNRADTISNAQYSFGLKEYNTSSSVNSLHYLGASILINRKVGFFKIGLGLEADQLLNVYGAIQQTQNLYPWEVTTPDLLTATISDSGRVESSAESKWLVSPRAKVTYDIRKRFSLSLGLKYQINPYVKDSGGPTTPFNKSGTVQLQAGVTCYIFNWKKSIK